jgi:L-threonylcarbamoyladenylate synthase
MVQTNTQGQMIDTEALGKALEVLSGGGIILFPTDTIWSLGCDLRHPKALKRLQSFIASGEDHPIVYLAHSLNMIRKYTGPIHPRVETLLAFHTRPLTVVYDEGKGLPEETKNPDGSVAFRLVQDDFCHHLINGLELPIPTLPARLPTEPFPRNFGSISSAILSAVDYVVPLRQQDKSTDEYSVVVSYNDKGDLEFLRE